MRRARTSPIVPGTSDYGTGENRVSFLVVDKQSQLIERPTARVWIARGLKQKPFAETTATLEPIGVPGGAKADAQNIYVTTVDDADAGEVLDPRRAGRRQERSRRSATSSSRKRAAAPEVGDRAIPSRNPTLEPGVDREDASTTAEPPDRNLLRTTVAAAMAAEAAVRRHVRDAALLPDADVRPGRPGRPVGREGLAAARASTSSTSRSTRTTTPPRARTGG